MVKSILTVVGNDLEKDTKEMKAVIEFYEERKRSFETIINGTTEDNIDCEYCLNLLSTRRLVNLKHVDFCN